MTTHAFRFEPEELEFAHIIRAMLLGEVRLEDIYGDDLDDAGVIVDDADWDC